MVSRCNKKEEVVFFSNPFSFFEKKGGCPGIRVSGRQEEGGSSFSGR